MNDDEFNTYLLVLAIMTVVSISITLYAIRKDIFFERTFKVVIGVLIIDAILLVGFLIKIFILKPNLF